MRGDPAVVAGSFRRIKPKNCRYCSKEFSPDFESQAYCNEACKNDASRAKRGVTQFAAPKIAVVSRKFCYPNWVETLACSHVVLIRKASAEPAKSRRCEKCLEIMRGQ